MEIIFHFCSSCVANGSGALSLQAELESNCVILAGAQQGS
jgi:hypothetical protein